jgi:hypothetical protein
MVIKRCDNVEGLAGLATARTTERERERLAGKVMMAHTLHPVRRRAKWRKNLILYGDHSKKGETSSSENVYIATGSGESLTHVQRQYRTDA